MQGIGKVEVSTTIPGIQVSFKLKELPVSDRRAIFWALLMDEECNPGQKEMPREQITDLFKKLDTYCKWEASC